jgi:hypothetical protein
MISRILAALLLVPLSGGLIALSEIAGCQVRIYGWHVDMHGTTCLLFIFVL